MSTDILDDLKARLAEIGFNDPQIEKVVLDVRRDYNGERLYISMQYEHDRQRSQRNRAIITDLDRGDSVEILMRRYKLSKRQLQRIFKEYDKSTSK